MIVIIEEKKNNREESLAGLHRIKGTGKIPVHIEDFISPHSRVASVYTVIVIYLLWGEPE